jgi:Ribonuclease G/E
MSKELVISAASHERRVAILEEGQLVEIYIEREKEFALVGSIYKGKVTRVLPGMQSAFVDIGLDGDAFLYVSDVFENLEDYDHGHPHEQPQPSMASLPPSNGSSVEVLPGESLARANERREEGHHEEARHEEFHQGGARVVDEPHASHDDAPTIEGQQFGEHHEASLSASVDEHHAESSEDRQPDSNASAPQNFSSHYNPTQSYAARSGNDRPGQNYGRGGDRGGDRGRGGRWGRRGGRHRGGRPQGGPGGRNLPPSKYASPQGGESRGYDNRSGQPRSYDNRRSEAPRGSAPSVTAEEEIILPGESLAKYRGKSVAAPAPAPIVEQEPHGEQAATEETTPRATGNLPAVAASGGVPRRFSGGLPRWLLADAGAEPQAAPSG